MPKTTAHLTIDLDDVCRAGSVREAISTWCDDSDDTSCGVVGPAFSTSGPGPGWSKQHDEHDFARRAMEEGAIYYLDLDDGRLASAPEWTDDMYDGQDIEWTDESVVCIACPDIEDAIERPALVAEMAQAVIDYHGPESDRDAWKKLIEQIREAAKALEDIDADDLDD